MAVKPVVRYLILCDDWGTDPTNPRRVNIYGLLSSIESLDQSPYPLLHPEMCVFLILTEGRGTGSAQVVCVFEETGQRIWRTPRQKVRFEGDPLMAVGMPFRVRDCFFPEPGVYSVQFWYNQKMLEERPLLLR